MAWKYKKKKKITETYFFIKTLGKIKIEIFITHPYYDVVLYYNLLYVIYNFDSSF